MKWHRLLLCHEFMRYKMKGGDIFKLAKRRLIDKKNQSRLINNSFGENSPINNDLLPDMPKGSKVILADDVYEILQLIQEKTNTEKKEVPFLLYGKTKGQVVWFYNIDASVDDLSGQEADFSSLKDELNEFIKKAKKDGSEIIAHGHTHPVSHIYNKSFSLGDMNAYADMRMNNDIFDSGKIELCSCLLEDGNYNFLFFDGNDYYKFNDVYVQNSKNGNMNKLPCYRKKLNINRNIER